MPIVTTPGDFEVSLSAKHRCLLKKNRFKNIKIKLQEREKYLKKLNIFITFDTSICLKFTLFLNHTQVS